MYFVPVDVLDVLGIREDNLPDPLARGAPQVGLELHGKVVDEPEAANKHHNGVYEEAGHPGTVDLEGLDSYQK